MVPVYSENPAMDVYLNTGALPRALLVYRSRVVSDHATAWQAIHTPGFDPTEVAVQRAAQRALREAVATERTPQAMLALAGAHEAVSEHRSAREVYAEIVESFPEAEESQTAVERLVHLT